MKYDFDLLPDRLHTESVKWRVFDEDVLPMWVADMDFRSPEPVIRALQERVTHGVFGYAMEMPELRETIQNRLLERYHWTVASEDIVLLPGVVKGFNMACHMFSEEGGSALIQTPVYSPFLSAPANAGLERQEMELTRAEDGSYQIDFDRFEAAITSQTRLFILCSPHNPVGRVFRKDELERMAEICLRHNVVICSDEIHCDLIFSGQRHYPTASLSPEIAQSTITLMAPSKTYNIAGLDCSFAVIQNPDLRRRFHAAGKGLVGHVNLMGLVAALAAYQDGQDWLNQALTYLEANRDHLCQAVNQELPGVRVASPEGTYLAWLDCRGAGIAGSPHRFFLDKARVAMNDGAAFGKGGEGFVRLNFGCPRSMLDEALARMKHALLNN